MAALCTTKIKKGLPSARTVLRICLLEFTQIFIEAFKLRRSPAFWSHHFAICSPSEFENQFPWRIKNSFDYQVAASTCDFNSASPFPPPKKMVSPITFVNHI
ncbi:hypothetical protein JOC33_002440 [Thalassobacillus pellis]|nr:hypothetical protein [Thalassobacillus pellis]